MAPIPKRSDQLHGHRKPPKVTKAPCGTWDEDENGDLVYDPLAGAVEIPCREPDVIYTRVRLRPGIMFEPDPDEEV